MLKLIENNHYHIWTDALHARALAHKASNRWDRGTYVRWSVMTAWVALEIACQDALEEPKISYSFKDNLNKAIKEKSFAKLDWSKGIWQQVLQVQQYRKNCVHRFSQETDLFPDTSVADNTIAIARQAIIEIYKYVGKNVPLWINDDTDQGWDNKENIREVLPAGTDPNPHVDLLIATIGLPISGIKVYRGKEVIQEIQFPMDKIRGT
jgi:hypothetical protein